ncbi:ABC transporter ATP-binding protein [Amycolatopsis azurea]|uniref:ABC transporter, ATP-binding/permease protein n=1 Tax=Amycolatopsis azurea DSM 43854 TaxID=1238180 RepID=M2PYR5_9PSEU|nr:ABC transporter ATP-binding protein [Amycolatopsis azurea]EMD29778.1 ABC transporter, ATP-binding/permease protein [Amycolatopsis azurea DSM 43854]OOC07415.1 multidrug ABC transporter permease [Amycolatopsis azurea DSM 43854]
MSAPGPRSAAVALGVAWTAAPLILLGGLAVSVATGVLPVIVAWLTKLVLDRVVAVEVSLDELTMLAAGLAVAGVSVALLGEAGRYLSAELARRVTLLTKDRLYLATGRLAGLTRLEQPAYRDRLHLAQQHSYSGPGVILDSVVGGVQAALTTVGFLVSLAAVSLPVTAVVLVAAVPTLITELKLSKRRAQVLTGLSPTERREFFYMQLMTGLDAAKEIRLLGLSRLFRGRMLAELREANTRRRRADLRELGVQGLLSALSAVVAGAGLIWAVLAAGRGQLTVGDIAVFTAAVAGVQGSLAGLVGRIGAAHNALLLFEHYRAVTAEGSDLPVPPEPGTLSPLRRGIEFRDVWFRYGPGHPWVLRGVNLFIPCGRSMALVGHNGAGKSTMVKLLCRFYDPTRGAVLWDGVDLRDLPVDEVRRRLGAVFQDFMTYEMSAAENIALGDVDGADELGPADERLTAAAGRAGIHDTLANLPRGYRTLLSRSFVSEEDKDDPETGVLLSGGQWQRVALARAFLRDRRDLLILDEPTSGLDAEAEHEIHTSLAEHRAGRTSVLISHRLGSVRGADRIAVLVDGQVAELGSHDELVSLGGTYSRLFRLQADGYVQEVS